MDDISKRMDSCEQELIKLQYTTIEYLERLNKEYVERIATQAKLINKLNSKLLFYEAMPEWV